MTVPDDRFCGACGGDLLATSRTEVGGRDGSAAAASAPRPGHRRRRFGATFAVAILALTAGHPAMMSLPGGPTMAEPSASEPAPAPSGRQVELDLPARLILNIGQYTIGGCATVCEDVGYCADFRIDMSNGDCTLQVETASPAFRALLRSCPQVAQGRGVEGEYDGRTWQLVCEP